MKFFNVFKIFNNNTTTATKMKLITDRGNGFFSWNGDLYESDIVRSCIRPFSKAIGKLQAKHIRDGVKSFQVNPDVYMKFLLEEPNPYMTGQMMQEKLAIQLKLNNNAFACIFRNEFGYATDIYPVPAYGAEAIYNEERRLYLKFNLQNGKTLTLPYSDVIHLRQDFSNNDVFGTSPTKALESLMEIVTTTDQGIIKAIQNGNAIKWLLKFTGGSLKEKDLTAQAEAFRKNFLSVDSDYGGAAVVDSKCEATQVKPTDYVPAGTQIDRTTTRIYNFFGVNEKIVQGKCSEDEWVAFFESEIEPIARQFSEELTRKIFSRRERGCGNRIIFEALSLQHASMTTKLNLREMVDRGAMTPNEWRHVMNLGPVEGGDEVIRRLDTAVVDDKELMKNIYAYITENKEV